MPNGEAWSMVKKPHCPPPNCVTSVKLLLAALRSSLTGGTDGRLFRAVEVWLFGYRRVARSATKSLDSARMRRRIIRCHSGCG